LGVEGDQQVGAGDLGLAGSLDVEHRALQDSTDADRLLDLALVGELGYVLLEELLELGAEPLDVGVAAGQHLAGAGIVEQREQQVLESDVLVTPPPGVFDGGVEGLAKFRTQHRDRPRVPWKPSTGTRFAGPACGSARPWSRRSRG